MHSCVLVSKLILMLDLYSYATIGAAGIWCCSPMTLSYLSNTISRPMEKRAVSIGVVKYFPFPYRVDNELTSDSQCSCKSIICIVGASVVRCEICANHLIRSGSYIWPSSSAPKYIPGFSVSIALMAGCVGTAFALMVLTKKYPYELTKDGGGDERSPSTQVA